jgi:hypothetical protein
MPDLADAKPTEHLVRVVRERDGAPALECGWALIRLEPESGNAVCEHGEQRIICPHQEFSSLNFPGSDDLWTIVSAPDDCLAKARDAWTKLDLQSVMNALVKYARTLDPVFSGAQTAADIVQKTAEAETLCRHSMDILHLEIKRARGEYNRFVARTAWENDEKDHLLSKVRGLEDKCAARAYRCENQLPIWRRLCAALEAVEAARRATAASP